MAAAPEPAPRRLHADQAHLAVAEERVEEADGVGAAAHAGHEHVGQPSPSCRRTSRPITDWKSRTIIGYGCGPGVEPMQ